MFCSNCGKTLKSDAVGCPHCGAVVGESRFDGHPYTGAQIRTRPGEAVRLPGNHTKTTFMGSDPSAENEVDARTTYRATGEGVPSYEPEREREPLYDEQADSYDPFEDTKFEEAASDEFEMPKDDTSEAEAPEVEKTDVKETEETDDNSELEELSAREIKLERRAGISADVRRYMNELRNDAEKPKKTGKRKRKEEEFTLDEETYETDDSAAFDMSDIPNGDETADIEADAEETDFSDFSAEDFASDEDIDSDLELAPRKPIAGAIKYIVAALVVVLVLVGVIVGLSYITDKTQKSPIDGVSFELYEAGIDLMLTRTGDDYQRSVLGMYNGEASIVNIAAKLTADEDGIKDVLPEASGANDPMFIETLKSIQKSISNTIFTDVYALASKESQTTAKAKSDENWAIVRGMVTSLQNATSTAHLDAIMKGDHVLVIESKTAEPTDIPAPMYTTLAKNSSGDAVINLQTRLTELGYLDDTIDGKFGNNTKTAVQMFQQASGLESTGIADEQTQIALFALDAVRNPYKK